MGLDNFGIMQVYNELLLQYYISSNFGQKQIFQGHLKQINIRTLMKVMNSLKLNYITLIEQLCTIRKVLV